ncbi:unnamed protein product [Rotaria sp. Silwood1]|nr:unnamed protein product [Rotaria sp. Silwood1]
MENKTYTHIQNSPFISNHSSNSDTIITTTTNSFVLSSTINTITTTTSALQAIPVPRSSQIYSDNNNGSNIIITQPTFKKLLSEIIKQEQVEDNSIQEDYSIEKNKLITNQSKINNNQQSTVITSVNINPRETINGISMANGDAHIMSALNSTHLPDGAGTYFVSSLPSDLASSYKLLPSSNSDLPSPSNSSNSSNPSSSNHHHHHPHHQVKRHGEGNDPTRKREMRLQKNREAARECRRKKKEYIKCLEERVTGLENQNKALIEELRQLKELYCQREETNNNTNNKTTNTTLYLNTMSLPVPQSPTSPNLHRSHSDRDLITNERRLSRTRVASTSTSNIQSQTTATTTTSISSNSSVPASPLLLPWDRLQKWLYGIAVVTFDLELGQSIELLLPNHCKLSDKEKLNLSYLSFPDANSTFLGDIQYHFRIHHESNLPTYYQYYNSIVPSALQVDNNSLFGYVHFRQIRDITVKRGYFQKSLVILSKLPFISLFISIVSQLGPNYFQYGLTSLETCCHLMDRQWPEPEPGKTLLLPLLGNVLQVRIPTHGDKPFSSSDLIQFRSIVNETMTTNNQLNNNNTIKLPIDDDTDIDTISTNNSLIKQQQQQISTANKNYSYTSFDFLQKHEQQLPRLIPFVHDVNTYQSLFSVLTHIQLLWELILLNEPIAVFGSFPTYCSRTVQALVHIIWPLRYASDYRPFFTIHNSEFQEITFNSSKKSSNKTSSSSKISMQPSLIIGVTNPFFAKLLNQWPHIIRVNDNQEERSKNRQNGSFFFLDHDEGDSSTNELDDNIDLSSSPQTTTTTIIKHLSIKKISTNTKPYTHARAINNNSSHLTFDIKPGLYTKYKSYLQRDKTILKKLQSTNAQQRPDTVQNALIRRFFLELTQSFIIPLERYFTSLLPLRKYYQVNRKPPIIKEFDNEEFLKTLDQYGPQLTSGLKGDWKELYKHFLLTPNFRLWLSNRRQEANSKIYSLYIETIANCRLEQDLKISKLTEIELVDLLLRFNDLIQRLESKTDELLLTIDQTIKNDYIEKLKIKIKIIIEEKLSDDMKLLFHKQVKISLS